jgi:hypothetical protein
MDTSMIAIRINCDNQQSTLQDTIYPMAAKQHVIPATLIHLSVKTTHKHCAHFSPAWAAKRALEILEGKNWLAQTAEDGRRFGGNHELAKTA